MKSRDTVTGRIRGSMRWFARGSGRGGKEARRAAFTLLYERFRDILARNDATLEVIADIEELVGTPRGFSLDSMTRRIRKAAMDVFLMVKDLNQIAENRHKALYDVLYRLNVDLEQGLAPVREDGGGRLVVPLQSLRASDAPLVGSKMGNLGEIGAACGLPVPRGFGITTEAYDRFMSHGLLWDRCERVDADLESGDAESFAEACRSMQADILATPVADDVAAAVYEAFDAHFPEPGVRVAMRSSAVGEDLAGSSHAGLYHTELDTDRGHLMDAYRAVLASAFSQSAVSYRFQRGITTRDLLMAVGCVRMIRPRCAGIIYSRLPDDPEADGVMVSATAGIAAGMAAGQENSENWVVRDGRVESAGGALLQPSELASLIGAARSLESHFGSPQDVEWAIDGDGLLTFLQTRPMTAVNPEAFARDTPIPLGAPILQGGFTACPGIASGSVVIARSESDLVHFPQGGILVARHSSPAFARVMMSCASIVTDVGSPTGHMASLAREFGIPAIVGLDGATRTLRDGQALTVDAGSCRIYEGLLSSPAVPLRPSASGPDSPALARIRRAARLVTPLSMTDPASGDFRPENCRSLHDITRYVHEKAFEVMFHYGDRASVDRDHSAQLQAKLPIRVEVFDVGGGLREGAERESHVRPEEILCVPMRAFLRGLLDPRIRWDLPRPISMRGFFSVLGESITGPPSESTAIGRLSYAIVSDSYMNFSTKAGYHFSTVDTYCGPSVNKNYIHFRFNGGAADAERRRRRVQFVSTVLAAMDFNVKAGGDMLVARLNKYGADDIQIRLESLGRLTLCARQLDMLMDTDGSPDFFARAFLAGEWHRF